MAVDTDDTDDKDRAENDHIENGHSENDRAENEKLSFPQRYWLLLCILVAVLSPIIVGWLNAAAHHVIYKQAVEQTSGQGGATSGSADASGSAGTSDSAGK